MTTTVVAVTVGLRVLAASDGTWRSADQADQADQVDQVWSVLLSGPAARRNS